MPVFTDPLLSSKYAGSSNLTTDQATTLQTQCLACIAQPGADQGRCFWQANYTASVMAALVPASGQAALCYPA